MANGGETGGVDISTWQVVDGLKSSEVSIGQNIWVELSEEDSDPLGDGGKDEDEPVWQDFGEKGSFFTLMDSGEDGSSEMKKKINF